MTLPPIDPTAPFLPQFRATFEAMLKAYWDDFYAKQEILLIHGKDDPRLDQKFWDTYNSMAPPLASENWGVA